MGGPISPAPLVTRFAPAPTGFLHLGHAVNALCVWGWARAHGALVRLRIEDHDRQRSRPEYEQAIADDLAWLGFEPDGPPTRQRDRESVYRGALERLARQGLVYGCTCTRADMERPTDDAQGERRYPNTCRDRGLPLEEGLSWRVRLEAGEERFVDLLHGPQAQEPARQCGDLLIRDRLGNWSYQFAVVADDMEQGITHVIRGDDLLASTGRQIRLARLLGRADPPTFAHHPLVMTTGAAKLSKSDGATGLGALRRAGWSPARVRAAAHAWAGDALARLER